MSELWCCRYVIVAMGIGLHGDGLITKPDVPRQAINRSPSVSLVNNKNSNTQLKIRHSYDLPSNIYTYFTRTHACRTWSNSFFFSLHFFIYILENY